MRRSTRRTGRSFPPSEDIHTGFASSIALSNDTFAKPHASGLRRGTDASRNRSARRVLWGDKVISVRNDSRRRVYPKMVDQEPYVANGDIGIAVGQWKTKSMKKAPWKLEVEFASQPGFAYDYGARTSGKRRKRRLSSRTH